MDYESEYDSHYYEDLTDTSNIFKGNYDQIFGVIDTNPRHASTDLNSYKYVSNNTTPTYQTDNRDNGQFAGRSILRTDASQSHSPSRNSTRYDAVKDNKNIDKQKYMGIKYLFEGLGTSEMLVDELADFCLSIFLLFIIVTILIVCFKISWNFSNTITNYLMAITI